MKVFSKVLALFLTLLMVLALVPISALASEPWLEGGVNDEDVPVVSLKLDAGALLEVLQSENAPKELIAALISGAEIDLASLTKIISLEELFEIVPQEDFLKIFDLEALLKEIGVEKLLSYVDVNAIAGTLDAEAIEALLSDVDDLAAVINAEKVVNDIDQGLLLKYVDEDKVFAAVDLGDAVDLVLDDASLTLDDLKGAVKMDALVSANKFAWSDLIDENELDDIDASVVADYVTVDDSDTAKVEALLGDSIADYLDASNNIIVSKVVDKVGINALLNDETGVVTVDLEGLLNDSRVDVYQYVDLSVAIATVKTEVATMSGDEVNLYINKNEVYNLIDTDTAVVELLGGYDKAVSYINISGLVADPDLDLGLLVPGVRMDVLVDQVGAAKLLEIVDTAVIMEQIDNEEQMELLKMIDLKPYVAPILSLVFRKTLSNVDELVIDGSKVASEDAYGMLSIDSAALVKALAGMIPTLDEIAAAEDGKLFTTRIGFKYTVDGTETQKSKDFKVEFVVDGDLSKLQAAAGKMSELLKQYIDVGYENGTVSFQVTTPAALAQVYNKFIDFDKLDDSTKAKVLDLVNLNGDKVVGFAGDLNIGDIVNTLDAIDLDAVYNKVLANAYVDQAVALVAERTGKDLSAVELDELYNFVFEKGTGVPAIQKINAAILDKTGYDAIAILEEYEGINEIYDIATNVAVEKLETILAARNYLINKLDLLPDAVLNTSIMSLYDGNGRFETSKTLSVNAKKILDKALSRAAQVDKIEGIADAIELLSSRLSVGTISVTFDLALQMTDIYSATYMDQENGKVLFKVFLPVGADLSVFTYTDVNGVLIDEWTDENGDAIATMPARDVVIYAGRTGIDVDFVDQNGNYLGTITLPSGDTLADYAEEIAAIEAKVELPAFVLTEDNKYLYDGYIVAWNLYDVATGKAASDRRIGLSRTVFTEDTTLIAYAMPDYFLHIKDVDYKVELAVDGTNYPFALTIREELPEGFNLNLDRAHLLTLANGDNNVTLSVKVGADAFEFLKLDDAILADFFARSTADVSFDFAPYAEAPASAAGSVYAKDENAAFFQFNLLLDGAEFHENFAGEMIITLPYDKAISYSNTSDAYATRVHVLNANGVREYLERLNADSDQYVAFKAPHFSDYVITNEYKLTLNFVSADKNDPNTVLGTLEGYVAQDLYFPAGATFVFNPVLTTNVDDYTLVSATYNNAALTFGATVEMPDGAIEITVTIQPRECYVYYYVAGDLYTTDSYFFYEKYELGHLTEAAVQAKNPNGYATTYQWIGFNDALVGAEAIYVSAQWDRIAYTVKFLKEDGSVLQTLGFNADNYASLIVPNVPAKAGFVGAWEAYDLADFIAKNATGAELTVKPTYTEITYKIVSDGIAEVPANAKVGETVQIKVNAPAGFDVTVTVVTANQQSIAVTNNSFKMPANDVYVNVVLKAKSLNYTINGTAGKATTGSVVTFDVVVPVGQVLTGTPKANKTACTLLNTKVEAGKLVLTYAFDATEDGIAVTWELADSKYNVLKIFNGKLFEDAGDPVPHDEAVFAGWSAGVAGYLQYATFTAAEKTASLWWLWVLIALIVIIAFIVIIYLLYKAGKIGLNGLTRVVLWIVNLFFTVCMALAAFALKVAGLFGWKEKEAPAQAPAEEPVAEEAAEEVVEEAAEEVAEEAAEEVAEEAAEEVAEEAAEEVAEEAAEEVAEEAAEEVAEEATEEPSDRPDQRCLLGSCGNRCGNV